MEATVRHCGGMTFVGRADSGHAVVMDAAPAVGGEDGAVRPSELVLIGLAGCTGMDVVSILRKKRQRVAEVEVTVRAEQATEHPRRFTRIEVEYLVRGEDVDPAAVRRAVELSEGTYCSVGATLRGGVEISSSFRILAPGETPGPGKKGADR